MRVGRMQGTQQARNEQRNQRGGHSPTRGERGERGGADPNMKGAHDARPEPQAPAQLILPPTSSLKASCSHSHQPPVPLRLPACC